MRRYWLEASAKSAEQVRIDGESFHHIFDVCRQDVGSHFEVLVGDQQAHFVEVFEVNKKYALAKIQSSRYLPEIPKPYLHLVLSVPRFPVMESLVEKAVELGVHTIHPVFSDFSFVRKASSLPEAKTLRWQKIVKSATQQSGRGELMKVMEATDLKLLLTQFNPSADRMGLFAYEGEGQVGIQSYLKSLRLQKFQEIWVFVGSEGGFSPTEVQEFQKRGLPPVSLGDQVLRVETACLALCAILKYEFAMS